MRHYDILLGHTACFICVLFVSLHTCKLPPSILLCTKAVGAYVMIIDVSDKRILSSHIPQITPQRDGTVIGLYPTHQGLRGHHWEIDLPTNTQSIGGQFCSCPNQWEKERCSHLCIIMNPFCILCAASFSYMCSLLFRICAASFLYDMKSPLFIWYEESSFCMIWRVLFVWYEQSHFCMIWAVLFLYMTSPILYMNSPLFVWTVQSFFVYISSLL